MGNGLADHVDGSPDPWANPTLCPKVSQTRIVGREEEVNSQVRSTSEPLACPPSQAAVRMSTTREVVMV